MLSWDHADLEAAWLGSIVVLGVAFMRGMRFRRGSDRSYVGLYRNRNLPAMYRHAPLALPYTAGYLLSLLLLGVVRALIGPIGSAPRLDLVLTTVGGECFIFAVVLSIVRMYAPPRWLTPRWLAEDDAAVGYERPEPGWADRGWLVIAVAASLAAILFAVYVAGILITRGWV
jgi:hypothetical protein